MNNIYKQIGRVSRLFFITTIDLYFSAGAALKEPERHQRHVVDIYLEPLTDQNHDFIRIEFYG